MSATKSASTTSLGPWATPKVAAASKSAVRLYRMLRQNAGYPEIALIERDTRVALRGEFGVPGKRTLLAGVNESHLETVNGRSRIRQEPGCPHGSIMVCR